MIIKDFIKNLPKAELHVHIEGTFEPELYFEIAARNKIKNEFSSIELLRKKFIID